MRLTIAIALLIAVAMGRAVGIFGTWIVDLNLQRLKAEQVRLSAFDESTLIAAKASALAPQRIITNTAWPKDWLVQAADSGDPSIKAWNLQSEDGPEWNAFLQTVNSLSTKPSNRIVRLDIRSRGSLAEREIASVKILLEHPIETQFSRSNSARTRFPRSSDSAKTPEVASGDPSRGPTASGVRAHLDSPPPQPPGFPGRLSSSLNLKPHIL